MRKSAFILPLLALFMACEKEQDFALAKQDLALVRLVLGVDGEVGETKVSPEDDEGAGGSVTIKNVWVLQFDGTTDAAILAADPAYIENFVSGSSSANLNVKLGHESTLVFIANTFSSTLNLGDNGKTTLAVFKKKFFDVTSQESLFGQSDSKYYQRLSGSCTATITKDTPSVELSLKRNIARVNITVVNNTNIAASEGDRHPIIINAVQLCSAPSKDYLFTNYSLPTHFPEDIADVTDYAIDVLAMSAAGPILSGGGTRDLRYYVPANKRGSGTGKYDTDMRPEAPHGATYFSVYAATVEENPKQMAFVFYLGTELGSSSPNDSTPVVNYDLLPNHTYSFTFTITDEWFGKRNSDSRINYYEEHTSFTDASIERSNCYILLAPPVMDRDNQGHEIPKYFTFDIPVEKADMFWSTYRKKPNGDDDVVVRKYVSNSVTDTFTSAEMLLYSDPENPTTTKRDWSVRLLWSDFDPTDNNLSFTRSSGSGKDDYFTVKVKGGVQGNAVVALVRELPLSGGGTLPCIVWSWHLWLTDYEPDQVPASAKSGSRYVYRVSGGKVIRYSTTAPFMMDRDLGATYNPDNPSFLPRVGISAGRVDPTLGMYYQFGRKDPFPNDRNLYYGDAGTLNSSYPEVASGANGNLDMTLLTDMQMAKIKRSKMNPGDSSPDYPLMWSPNGWLNVPFSINHPMIFIFGNNTWNKGVSGSEGANEDRFNPSTTNTSIIWMDPLANGRNDVKWGNNKSVFDPCPKGWKLPGDVDETGNGWPKWSGSGITDHKSNASFLNAWGENQIYGCYLWPQGTPTPSITEADLDRADFYPFAGYCSYDSGNLVSSIDQVDYSNRRGPHWISRINSVEYARSLALTAGDYKQTGSYQAQGYSVRCVKY